LKAPTARSRGKWIPPLIGILVAAYWLAAFWAALTTPIRKDPPPYPWEPIDLLRDPGLRVGGPIFLEIWELFPNLDNWGVIAVYASIGIGFGAISWLVAHFIRLGCLRRSRHQTVEKID